MHRIGQTEQVEIFYLCADTPGSLDKDIFEKLERKKYDTSTVMDGRAVNMGLEEGVSLGEAVATGAVVRRVPGETRNELDAYASAERGERGGGMDTRATDMDVGKLQISFCSQNAGNCVATSTYELKTIHSKVSFRTILMNICSLIRLRL